MVFFKFFYWFYLNEWRPCKSNRVIETRCLLQTINLYNITMLWYFRRLTVWILKILVNRCNSRNITGDKMYFNVCNRWWNDVKLLTQPLFESYCATHSLLIYENCFFLYNFGGFSEQKWVESYLRSLKHWLPVSNWETKQARVIFWSGLISQWIHFFQLEFWVVKSEGACGSPSSWT